MEESELNVLLIRAIPDLALQKELLPPSRRFLRELRARLESQTAFAATDNLLGDLHDDDGKRMSCPLLNKKFEDAKRHLGDDTAVSHESLEFDSVEQATHKASIALLAARVGGGAPLMHVAVTKSDGNAASVAMESVVAQQKLTDQLFHTQRQLAAAYAGAEETANALPLQISIITSRMQSFATVIDNLASVGLLATSFDDATQGTRHDAHGRDVESGPTFFPPSSEILLANLHPTMGSCIMRSVLTLDLIAQDKNDELCFVDGISHITVADTLAALMSPNNAKFVKELENAWADSRYGSSSKTAEADFVVSQKTPPQTPPTPPTPEASPPPLQDVAESALKIDEETSLAERLNDVLYDAVAKMVLNRCISTNARPSHHSKLSPRAVISHVSPTRVTSALALAASALQFHWRQ